MGKWAADRVARVKPLLSASSGNHLHAKVPEANTPLGRFRAVLLGFVERFGPYNESSSMVQVWNVVVAFFVMYNCISIPIRIGFQDLWGEGKQSAEASDLAACTHAALLRSQRAYRPYPLLLHRLPGRSLLLG
jgi:hypothetical protein